MAPFWPRQGYYPSRPLPRKGERGMSRAAARPTTHFRRTNVVFRNRFDQRALPPEATGVTKSQIPGRFHVPEPLPSDTARTRNSTGICDLGDLVWPTRAQIPVLFRMLGVDREHRKQHWHLQTRWVHEALRATTVSQIPVQFGVHVALSHRHVKTRNSTGIRDLGIRRSSAQITVTRAVRSVSCSATPCHENSNQHWYLPGPGPERFFGEPERPRNRRCQCCCAPGSRLDNWVA